MIQKYRAWHKEEKRMYEVSTIYFDNDAVVLTPIDGFDIIDEKMENIILMQSIGLFDKNNKEIFEGDIIKLNEILWLVEPINSLERDGNNYGLCVSPGGNGKNYFIDSSILKGEIIGNIHENPELLNNKNGMEVGK